MINLRTVSVSFIACVAAASSASGLPLGSFKVGFKQQWHFDYGRTYQMTLNKEATYGTRKSPRPILMNLWYPVAQSTKGKPMWRSEYLDFIGSDPKIKGWQRAFQLHNREVICQEVLDSTEKELNRDQKLAWDKYMRSATPSIKNALPAKGKFPLVIYHQGYGSSVEDNNEFCEYMASWGYVVVNSSYLAADGKSFNIDSRTGSADDIRFLTSYLKNQPNVNWEKIGLVGHSGGAHTALKYRAVPGVAVEAIVCLDTTQDYYSLADTRWTFVNTDLLPNLDQMRGNILMTANPYAIFQLADRFVNADRTYYTTVLDHNEFISQGVQMLRVTTPLLSESKRDESAKLLARAEKNYADLCTFTRLYLQSHLKGSSAEYLARRARLVKNFPSNGAPAVELMPKGREGVGKLLEGTTTPRLVRNLIEKKGIEHTANEIRQAHRENKANPIFELIFIFALEFELLKANRVEDAKVIYETYTSLGINHTVMFYNQARLGELTKNYAFAEDCLKMLLTFDPTHSQGKKLLDEIRKKTVK